MLRVFIVERQRLFATALASILSADPEIEVVGVAADRGGASPGMDLDVVIVDVESDTIDGALEHFRQRSPDVKLCAISANTLGDDMQRCLGAGADGYVVKDASPHELLAAIKSLGKGASYVDPRVAGSLLRRRRFSNGSIDELSPREKEVIRLIAQGLSNRDIGRLLALSEKTIKNHVSHIFAKIHCVARSQAAVHAIRAGLTS
jgi:DNA-binding NarL/FixJ family response regulator